MYLYFPLVNGTISLSLSLSGSECLWPIGLGIVEYLVTKGVGKIIILPANHIYLLIVLKYRNFPGYS